MSRNSKRRPKFPFNSPASFAMTGLLGIAGFSQIKLQVFEVDSTLESANKVNKYFTTKTDRARRGSLYTADMKPLAEDANTFVLTVNFAKIPRTPGFAIAISEASGIAAHEFTDRVKGTRSWGTVLSSAQKDDIAKVKKDWSADGVSLEATQQRTYPLGVYTGALVGYQKPDPSKKATDENPMIRVGLERSLNEVLSGIDGKQKGLQDKNGEFLPLRSMEPEQLRKDGSKVVTTLDSQVQSIATNAVRKAVESNKADNGVAIVVNPKTGDVIAMASWPVSDPNSQFSSLADGANPAYMNVLEPGSTFKILTLAKAVHDGVVVPGQISHCSGVLPIGTRSRIRCDEHHGNRAHGDLTPEMAIAKSCNVAAAMWARSVGSSDFFQYLDDLGLREKTGLNLYQEGRGRATPDKWAPALQLANMGFGQSMSITPLALADAFSTIANNGMRMPLRLVKSIDGKTTPLGEGKSVLSKAACDYTLQCMEAVVQSDRGTGKTLRVPGYLIGGKTGTAQKVGKDGAKGYVANFVGVIPSKDPKAVVLVMINNPKGGKYYGADVAGPVFADVARSVIKEMKIAPTEPIPTSSKSNVALKSSH